MNKNKAKKIATWIIVPLMASFFILDIITVAIGNKYQRIYAPINEMFDYRFGDDRIHFLNTANSDCIILESNGHFAMIDSGEGNSNPRRKTKYTGFENVVIDYLNKNCSDSHGNVHLDFILGTHYHYDHVGCFHRILSQDNISVDKGYFKEYCAAMDGNLEGKWGLPSFYEEILHDMEIKGVEHIINIPETIYFYDFKLSLFNTGYYEDLFGKGENASSIGIKVEKDNISAFLAADITGPSGLEKKLGKQIGHCDLLKIGHHGYYGSSSMSFLDCLTPKVAIVTNQQGKVYPNVKWNLTMHAKIPFYGTYDYNGIIASFTDDNKIILTNGIH